jgi:hypothetical protein
MITKVTNCANCPYLIYDDTDGNDCHFPNNEVDHYELPDFGDKTTIPEKCLLKGNNMFITQLQNIESTVKNASAKYCDDIGLNGNKEVFDAFCAGVEYILKEKLALVDG